MTTTTTMMILFYTCMIYNCGIFIYLYHLFFSSFLFYFSSYLPSLYKIIVLHNNFVNSISAQLLLHALLIITMANLALLLGNTTTYLNYDHIIFIHVKFSKWKFLLLPVLLDFTNFVVVIIIINIAVVVVVLSPSCYRHHRNNYFLLFIVVHRMITRLKLVI